MRFGRVGTAALALCLAGWTGAQAQTIQPDGIYLRAEGGWNHLTDLTGTGNGSSLNYTQTHDEGFILGGAVGLKQGPWHFEINMDYRNNGLSGLTIANPGLLPLGAGSPGQHAGNVTSWSEMINVLYDLPVELAPRWQPYVGLGAGAAIVRLNSITANQVPITASNTDSAVPALQPILGIRYDIDTVKSLSLEYRFLNGFGPGFTDGAGRHFGTSDYQSHSIMLALTFALGGAPAQAAAAQTTAVTPPPPPPPPPGARNEFIVYFDFDKSALTGAARQILDEASAAYKQNNSVKISVTGYTDTVGTVQYNLALSRRRADAVRNYLATKGVPTGAMDVSGKGKSDLRVPTPDGVREPQNRRVEIILP